jgi:hypothetical protein
VTGNDEERPFSRDQRRWVYASSKKENNYFGFGTDNDLERSSGYVVIKHAPSPCSTRTSATPTYDPRHRCPCGQGHRRRTAAARSSFAPSRSSTSRA